MVSSFSIKNPTANCSEIFKVYMSTHSTWEGFTGMVDCSKNWEPENGDMELLKDWVDKQPHLPNDIPG
ncbi:hypothetical protein GE061_005901 [Apolygus lucorum]|uniref:Uncharacterized protein n=1 Tax=Apolygus lucorum TaxID=248454 RepID=A0A8S9WXH8_APOLU|nr:hypothetical protein GE061_005901 [Apolygus lucorum]